MRILIGGFGSRGDMQPMLALGLALKSRGHVVTMCGPPDFAAWADELALPFVAVGASVQTLVERGTDRNGKVRPVIVLREARTMGQEHFAALEPLVARSDLVVASGITVAGASLAEKYGIPYVFVGLCPQVIPSGEHPHPMVARQTLPGTVNRLTWRVGALANNLVFRGIVNREQARLGLAPIRDVWATLSSTA
jgi:vancomycin aglycone glucosyltransferase